MQKPISSRSCQPPKDARTYTMASFSWQAPLEEFAANEQVVFAKREIQTLRLASAIALSEKSSARISGRVILDSVRQDPEPWRHTMFGTVGLSRPASLRMDGPLIAPW